MPVPEKQSKTATSIEAASRLATAHETARRLTAVMEYLNLRSVRLFAEFLGCQRSQVSNWMQGYHFPRVTDMARLCEKMNNQITLDWIYRGVQTGMPYGMTVHLQSLLEGIEGPNVAPEPQSKPASAAAVAGRLQARKKGAGKKPGRRVARSPA